MSTWCISIRTATDHQRRAPVGHAWGATTGSLGVRLPAKVARAAHLHVDQRVRMHVEDGRVVIEPAPGTHPSLADRLALFDAQRHGGEAMSTTDRLGAERW